MRIVIYNGGLGNQIFAYLFSLYLNNIYQRERIYGAYWSGSLSLHQGLELEKCFDISLPKRTILTDIISKVYRLTRKWNITHFTFKDKLKPWNIVLDHYWLDKKYYAHINLRDTLKFNKDNIDNVNKDIAQKLSQCDSVAVHIRRGDYCNVENQKLFGKYCTKDYYKKAIELLRNKRPECVLYFFSDDIDYVKENFNCNNSFFIDTNRDADSWKDLYLIASCRHHIIANSTFSYWGAMLSEEKKDSINIAPKKWFHWDDPDIFPDNWIRM